MDLGYFKKHSLRILAGVIFCLFLVLIDGLGWLGPLYSWGNYVLKPIQYWVGRSVDGLGNVVSTVLEVGNLRNKNNELRVKNAELKAELSKYSEIEKENEALRKQVDIEDADKMKLKMVRILGIDRNGLAEHVIIDAGEDEDVSIGDVIIIGDIYLGEVRNVYKSTSKVRLITNQNSNVVAIDQETGAKGLVRGGLSGIVIEEVLENEELNVGDRVVAWSDDVPSGLFIGEITKVENQPTSSTKKAFLDSGINIEELGYVFVVLDYK